MPGAISRVALNACFFDPGRSGGTETYLRGLVPALAEEFPRTRFTLLTTRRGAAKLVDDGWRSLCDVVALPTDEGERGRRLAAELALAPASARAHGADVLHSLSSVGPFACGPAHVVTLHDVTFLRIKTFSSATIAAFGALMLAAAHTADGLLSGSSASRDDVAERLRLDAAEIAVVPHGYGRSPGAAADPERVRAELGVDPESRLVLCVAALRPHKNQALLVRALEHLPHDVVVVLCGIHEPYAEDLADLAAELGVADRLRMPGYLEDAVLEGAWRLAAAAALPTLGEGFGLPVLEAFARGLGLACSDLTVLREVGGVLPQYFDPHDPADAAAAIERVMAGGADRAALEARAASFTWTASARGTYEVYERTLAAR